MKCFIYRNLHKLGQTYSFKALEGEHKGRVVAYAQSFLVKDVQFVVHERGRQRVINTGRKNVHAGIVGDVVEAYLPEMRLPNSIKSSPAYININRPSRVVKYNPHKAATFYDAKTDEPVHSAEFVSVRGSLVEAH